jgi:hypothetical protein
MTLPAKTKRKFRAAYNLAVKIATYADPELPSGNLQFDLCRSYLEQATGAVCQGVWTADDIAYLHENADWSFDYEKRDKWAVVSALKWLEVAAEMGIEMDWGEK